MKKLFKIVFSIALLIIPALYFGINDKTVQMGLIIIPSMMCVILINLDELKKSIVSIKTKDMEIKFKDAIDKAYATIEQLNKTQHVLTKVATEILHGHKYWGGCTIISSLDTVDELYDLAKKGNMHDTINGPIKIAYERLIGEAFSELTEDMNDSEGADKITSYLHMIFTCNRDSNIFSDAKYIPSPLALTRLIEKLDIPKEGLVKFKENLKKYERTLNTYQKIYGKIKLSEDIPIVGKETINET